MACVIVARITTKGQYWSTFMVDLYVWLSLPCYLLARSICGNADDNDDCKQSYPALHLIPVVFNAIRILFSIWQWEQTRPDFHVPRVKFITFINGCMRTWKWSGTVGINWKHQDSDENLKWASFLCYLLCNWLKIRAEMHCVIYSYSCSLLFS